MSDLNFELTPSMERVREVLDEHGAVPAWTVAETILKQHPEYGNDAANELIELSSHETDHVVAETEGAQQDDSVLKSTDSMSEAPTESYLGKQKAEPSSGSIPTKHIDEWLFDVQEVFQDTRPPPRLHGRLVLIGLAVLDENVRETLRHDGFIEDLVEETIDFEASVSVENWREILYDDSPSIYRENTQLLDDSPVVNPEADRLNRQEFASYLAVLIKNLASTEEGSRDAYSVHLSGDWGAGKTTILNFLKAELERGGSDHARNSDAESRASEDPTDPQWKVVQFNAWQNQHINPPWWALLDRTYRESQEELSRLDKIREWLWRRSRQRVQKLVAGFITILLAVGLISLLLVQSGSSTTSLQLVGGIAALLTILWTISVGVSKPLVLHSAEAAESYVKYASEPMSTIEKRFKLLIDRIDRDRVAIFIDDIDRCESQYVVRLLEGIQTLFRGAPVVFVVAGDRDWIDTSFEEEYQSQSLNHTVEGKSLGTKFLEKTFQLTAPVPEISKAVQADYVEAVTDMTDERDGSREGDKPTSDEVQQHVADIEKAENELDIMNVLEMSEELAPEGQRTVRSAAVRKFGTVEIREQTEHVLVKFVSLLEPNPRGIKRLVNTYGVNRVLATLAHMDISQNQLALWTIIYMRWPNLAKALTNNPDLVAASRSQDAVDQSDSEKPVLDLLDRKDVRDVLDWEDEPLRADTVRQCARIWG